MPLRNHHLTEALLATAIALACGASALAAQCPDGTPPPCRGARPLAPRLDEHTWLILPFTNTLGTTEATIVRDASVDLLAGDLARWQDLRVVDERRVADLLRDLPASGRDRPGLGAARRLAQRVGAANLVLGNYLAVGGRAHLLASVVDVRSGREARKVEADLAVLTSLDSLRAAFERLGRKILSMPPLSDAGRGGAGTSSLEAYRQYLSGVSALNRFAVDTAVAALLRAVALDSSFALAQYRLSVAQAFVTGDTARIIGPLRSALARTDDLPPRERTLIRARLAQLTGDYGAGRRLYGDRLRADSLDTEALFGLGRLERRDPYLAQGGDSTLAMPRGDWNLALRLLRRVLDLDPGYYPAFNEINQILTAVSRVGCAALPCPRQNLMIGPVLRVGDTLASTLRPLREVSDVTFASDTAAMRSQRENRSVLHDLLADWVVSNPRTWRSHRAFATSLARRGDLAGADRELAAAAAFASGFDRRSVDEARVAVLLRRERPDAAWPLVDSLGGRTSSGEPSLAYFAHFGRFHRLARVAMGWPVWAQRISEGYLRSAARLELGTASQADVDSVRSRRRFVPGSGPADRSDAEAIDRLLAPAASPSPAFDTASWHGVLRSRAWLAMGDTVRARREIAEFDAWLRGRAQTGNDDYLSWQFAAEARLMMADTVRGLAILEEFGRAWPNMEIGGGESIISGPSGPMAVSGSVGRIWSMWCDLAAAAGRPETAVRACRMVVGLWGDGDPEIQPSVARARAALDRFTPRVP